MVKAAMERMVATMVVNFILTEGLVFGVSSVDRYRNWKVGKIVSRPATNECIGREEKKKGAERLQWKNGLIELN